ncbi:general stress protein [Marinilactibacillus sp. XAAS-LB27]|uniref:general stress protein n=1 Tax=Marinilactibacillus sp. XAAS-LB27 TaxID=3114538 RepID=UPI002E16F022|nr:general stress protein [Marinilactibacillus sp. XAAS-LB27]
MKKNQTVIGSYKTEKEVIKVVTRLMSEGYLKDEITLFANQKRSDSLKNPEHLDVAEPDINGNDADHGNEKSFWDSIKDAFKVREDHHFDDPNYTTEDDLLHHYRDNLSSGEIIVVVNNFKGQGSDSSADQSDSSDEVQDLSQATGAMGSIAGFPEEGAVQGMTDGGQPPLEPEQSEGTPPELEDTTAQADVDDTQNKREKRINDEL